MSLFDVVVIGGGPGGYNAAIRAGQLGMRVACVERAASLGGTCLNVGCMPSKALLHASELYELAQRQFARLGIEVTPVLDLAQMMRQKDESVATLVRGVEYLFKKYHVEWIRGHGRIEGPGRVKVGEGTTHLTLETRHIVIATGSEPAALAGVPIDGDRVVDSTGALALQTVPESLVVVGGGVIGLELASVWRRLGSRVSVIEYAEQLCPGMDAELATALQKSLRKQGIDFHMLSEVTGVAPDSQGVDIELKSRDSGSPLRLRADRVLVAVGRRAYCAGLGLESVGISLDARGRIPHRAQATGVNGIWVIGDVTTGPMLAHKAEQEAIACIEQIAGIPGEVNYAVIPSVVYTRPEAASVGKTEEELRAAGICYRIGTFPFAGNSRAKINHETEGFVKVLADATTDRILGVHMLGPNVGDMIGEYCVAMEFSAASEDIARTCHPHPTRAEALRQAAMAAQGWMMQA
jgi:dihydrolipoamide dehydrogenase